MVKTRDTFALDLTGQTFGKWTVISKANRRGLGGEIYWVCRCSCGKLGCIVAQSLRNGRSQSCGCQSRSVSFKHGLEGTRIYNTWAQMVGRCHNPNATSYKNYGARGIKVCELWRDFRNFYADMGDKPEGKTLDRYPDKEGNYEPGNVRWATPTEQSRNKRNSIMLEWDGKEMPLGDIAEMHGLTRRKLAERLRKGMPMEDAIKNVRYNAWYRRGK